MKKLKSKYLKEIKNQFKNHSNCKKNVKITNIQLKKIIKKTIFLNYTFIINIIKIIKLNKISLNKKYRNNRDKIEKIFIFYYKLNLKNHKNKIKII